MYDSDAEPIINQTLGSWETWLTDGRKKQYPKWDELPTVQYIGQDARHRAVFIIAPTYFGTDREGEMRNTFCFAAAKVHPILSKKKTALVVCFSPANWTYLRDPDFLWLQTFLDTMPRGLRKNIQRIYVCYPSVTTSAAINANTPFVPTKFWHKYHSITKLEDVLKTLALPDLEKNAIFPHISKRAEALQWSSPMLPVFGEQIEVLSGWCGRSTKRFNNLPEPLIRLAQAILDPQIIGTRDLLSQQTEAGALYSVVAELERCEFNEPLTANVPALITAFKVFLESLPKPLLGDEAFDEFLSLAKEHDWGTVDVPPAKLSRLLSNLIGKLTIPSRNVLSFVVEIFEKIAKRQRQNMMTPRKLAENFGAAFARPSQWGSDTPKGFQAIIDCVIILIEDRGSFFEGVGGETDESADDDDDTTPEEDDTDDETDDDTDYEDNDAAERRRSSVENLPVRVLAAQMREKADNSLGNPTFMSGGSNNNVIEKDDPNEATDEDTDEDTDENTDQDGET